jgi:ethanolamine utilization microcompartment shell protein EutL
MKRAVIQCINKSDRASAVEAITHVGGNIQGAPWKQSVETTIDEIESGKWDYYVQKERREVKVVVAVSRVGNKYLRTEADDYEPNNLLSLPECP